MSIIDKKKWDEVGRQLNLDAEVQKPLAELVNLNLQIAAKTRKRNALRDSLNLILEKRKHERRIAS